MFGSFIEGGVGGWGRGKFHTNIVILFPPNWGVEGKEIDYKHIRVDMGRGGMR